MFVMDNIRRIDLPSLDAFEAEVVGKAEPLILRGLFRGQPLAEASTVERFVDRFGDVEVDVCDEFFPSFVRSGLKLAKSPERMLRRPARDYLSGELMAQGEKRMVSGMETPLALAEAFEVPELCGFGYDANVGVWSEIFMGQPGNVAHLHFDTDMHHVLLYQVFGAKRVTLFPARVGRRLRPLLSWSALCLDAMSEHERRAFMEYGEAWDALLLPGEALYMPPLIWHHLDYVQTALTVTFRFGQRREHDVFSQFIFTTYLQNLLSTLTFGGLGRHDEREVERRLVAALDAKADTPWAKHLLVEQVAKELYRAHCPEATQGYYAFDDDTVVRRNVEHLAAAHAAYRCD